MTLPPLSAHSRLQTPEIRLLLLCCRLQWKLEEEAEARSLATHSPDWEKIRQLAERHRVLPLLNLNLARLNWTGVPDSLRNVLKDYAGRSAARSLHLTMQLAQMLARLQAEGIPAIPFKGPVMSQRVYGAIGLREFLDLDLLVHREHIVKCKRLLNSWGYTSPEKQNGEWEAAHIDAQLGLDFASTDGTVQFEIHWAFIQKWLGFRSEPPDVWKRAENTSFFGNPIKVVAADDLLPYLCAHGAKHKWANLFWLVDIAELLRKNPTLNWSVILEDATRQNNLRTLLLALKLAATMLGAKLPVEAEALILKDAKLESLEREITGWMFEGLPVPPDGSDEETRFYADVKEHWADRLHYRWHLLHLIFRPSKADYEFLKLPEKLSFLYLLVRPVRLLLRTSKH